ncbi:AAA family ATPase [Martelella lutilitoris]|uniref:AAA family ATPase n=1 Tax=Martelella lutilitoris TaxID=2583532 RepID=A0A5C4JVU1_9HYPH|nr:AAA family ATPase [Martelella lutilitoris]
MISFAGLPGVGKTTIARLLARKCPAVFLRVDEIEAVLRAGDPGREIGPLGYEIAAALATSNLRIGQDVIIDCVNPWPLTRAMFARAASAGGAGFLGVEIVCRDKALHRARLEGRVRDIGEGHVEPDWQAVLQRDYAPWPEAALHLDTGELTAERAAVRILAALGPGPAKGA